MSAADRLLERLRQATALAAGVSIPVPGDLDFLDPQRLRRSLEAPLAGAAGRVRVAGTLDRRLAFIERLDGRWAAADLSGAPHGSRAWPQWADGHLRLDDPGSWLSLATLDDHAVYRLSRPDVQLVALYHPENFPLPRFPLGISDVARAARSTLLGTVRLGDMQLGLTLPELAGQLTARVPDILGISATFGQHDLMTGLLDIVYRLPRPPVVIAGGSLTARNEAILLERYPGLLVARGGGEATIEALLAHWHGDIPLEQVPGLGYAGAARGGGLVIARRTARPVNRDTTSDLLPELDLLPATFAHGGVVQLEGSRMNGVTRSVAFRKDGSHLASTSAVTCGFVPMQGVGGQPEAFFQVPVPGGGRITLRYEDNAPAGSPLTGDILAGEPASRPRPGPVSLSRT
jgi:hypothetical protein